MLHGLESCYASYFYLCRSILFCRAVFGALLDMYRVYKLLNVLLRNVLLRMNSRVTE